MKTTDLNIAPFHKVDMSSYLSASSYESVMVPFCKFAIECSEHLLTKYADQLTPACDCIDCIIDDMDVLVSIENCCNMYLTRNTSGYAQFYLPVWFLIELLKMECKRRAMDLISFTISLIREANQ
jgi:hypothetical protein